MVSRERREGGIKPTSCICISFLIPEPGDFGLYHETVSNLAFPGKTSSYAGVLKRVHGTPHIAQYHQDRIAEGIAFVFPYSHVTWYHQSSADMPLFSFGCSLFSYNWKLPAYS